MDDRRNSPRKAIQYPGLIVADGQPVRQCMIADVSSGGARLIVRGIESLPSRFKLMWSHTARTGSDCVVRWRDPEAVGVQFVRLPSLKPSDRLAELFRAS
jgi:hypothetical protein